MLIKRNVYFSAVDEETGEERLFSVNEILTEEDYLERMYSESEFKQKEFGKFDLQLAKKIYPKYAEYVGGNPAAMKKNLRFWRAKGIEQSAMKKDINGKLLKKEIKSNRKRNKQLENMGKKSNRVAGYLDVV